MVSSAEPVWESCRRRVPGAPADLTLHVLPVLRLGVWAAAAGGCLTDEERARAEGLDDDGVREAFVVSRVVLRHVLARRVGCRPAEVPIGRDPHSGRPHEIHGHAAAAAGRRSGVGPELAEGFGRMRTVHFSVSRAGGTIAVAASHRAVGVDVEALQTAEQAESLISLLHPEDRARLSRVGTRRRAGEVTQAWTRVEALVKGLGTGLAVDPVHVRVLGDRRMSAADGWQIRDVRMPSAAGVRAAVAWQDDTPA